MSLCLEGAVSCHGKVAVERVLMLLALEQATIRLDHNARGSSSKIAVIKKAKQVSNDELQKVHMHPTSESVKVDPEKFSASRTAESAKDDFENIDKTHMTSIPEIAKDDMAPTAETVKDDTGKIYLVLLPETVKGDTQNSTEAVSTG